MPANVLLRWVKQTRLLDLQSFAYPFLRNNQNALHVRKSGRGKIVEVSKAMLERLPSCGILDRETNFL